MILLNHILLIVTLVTIITSGIIGAYLLSKNPPYKILGFISAISFFWTGLSFLLLSKVFSIDPLILLELQSLILSAASILWLDFSLLYSILKKQWYNFGFKFSYLALVFIAISLLVYNFERGLTQEAVQIIKIAWMLSSVFQLAILATSIYLLRKTSLNRPNHNKYQFKALIIAVTLPFIAILIYLLQGFDAFINKDYYSLSVVFTLSNISLFVALFRSSLVEHLPNTYQSLFSSNKNLIILLDRQANIMNYNPAAKLFLEKLSISPINQNIYKLIPNLPSKEEHFKDIAVNIFSYNLDDLDIYADISFYPVRSIGFKINAYILEIKDVSSHIIDFKQIEQLSKFQQALISLASHPSEHGISNSFYQVVLEHAIKLIPDADMGTVVLKSANGKFKYVAAVGFPLAAVEAIQYSKEQVFFGELKKHKNPLVKRHDGGLEKSHIDNSQFIQLKKTLPIIEDIKATLAIPVFLESELKAVLSLDSIESYNAFDIEAINLSEIFSQKITDFIQKSHIQAKLIKEANLKFLFSNCEQQITNYKIKLSSLPRMANIILKAKDLSVEKISFLEIDDLSSRRCISYCIENNKLKKSFFTISEKTSSNIMKLIDNAQPKYIKNFKDNPQLGKSLYLAPLSEIDGIKTMLIASAKNPYAFDNEEHQFLDNAHNCLIKLIEKQKVESKLEQLSNFRKAIVQISDEFLGENTNNDFYNKLLIKAIEIIPEIDKGSVLLLRDDNRYHFQTTVGFDLPSLQQISFPIEEFPFDYNLPAPSFLINNLAELVIPNLDEKQLDVLQEFGNIEQIKFTIYIPIRISGSLQGFFCLDSTSSNTIEDSSQEMAQILGSQVANMLQRTQILRQAQQQAKSYAALFESSEKQRQKLLILNNIIKFSAQNLEIKQLLQTTADIISKTLNNNYVAIVIFDKDLRMYHPSTYIPMLSIRENIKNGIGIIPEIAKTGKAIFLEDVSKSNIYIGDGKNKIKSEIAVPIKIKNKTVGVLNIEHIKGLDTEDFELAQSLAEQLGISLTRAKLFKQVKKSELQLKLLTENTKDIISLHDLNGKRIYLSPSVKEVLGYSSKELIGKHFDDKTHPDDLKKVNYQWQQLIEERNIPPEKQVAIKEALIYRKKHRSGNYIWLEMLGNYICDKSGNVTGYVAATRDVSKRIKLEESLKKQALYDELTGLANRRLFLDRLEQSLKQSQRKNKKIAVLFFDLDRFKLINDSYGHSVGDKLLIEISKRLKLILRKADTAARLGGDEFCVLIEDINSETEILQIVHRLQTAINQPFSYDGQDINIVASFGLAINENQYSDATEILRDADIAMYESKHQNQGGGLSIFNQAMYKRIVERLQTDSDLRKAIEKDEFRLEYQPIFNLSNKEIVGFESLLRWHHTASNCQTSPNIFIPIAEENGFITEIDMWVLKKSCKQLVKWRNKYDLNGLSISVNLSARTFEMPKFIDILEEIIKSSGIKKHELKLELTERTIMQNPDRGIEILNELRSKGIEIHIDDFGTGYSSLSYLHKLQFNTLKIDRSFVNLIGQKEEQGIIETIVTLAKSQDLEIIAEGIETKVQLETLRSLGCEYGQGWYFSKSLEPKQIEENYFIKTLTKV